MSISAELRSRLYPVSRLRAEMLAELIPDDELREQVLSLIRAGRLDEARELQERHRRRRLDG